MAGNSQPLDQKFPIVDAQGRPTEYFTRWAQQRQIDIADGITAAQAVQLIEDWAAQRQVIAGVALDGGGPLSSDVTINHADSLVVAGTYGDATNVPQFVVDAEGHIQGVVQVPISSGAGGGLYNISMGIPNPITTLGDAANYTWTANPGKGANVKKGAGIVPSSCAGWIVPKTTGAAWEVAVLLIQNNYGTQYYGCQIGLYNSTSGRLITLADFQGLYNQTEFHRYNSYNNRNDIPNTYGNGPHQMGPKWMHIKDDGAGNIELGLSGDGANPVWMKATTVADWVGAYTHVFFGGFFEATINVNRASVSVLCYDPNGASRVVGV